MDKFRVLVVDDETRITRFLEVRLRAAGYEVLTANDGTQALELVHTQDPDLIVLDIVMPGTDGFETLKHVRAVSAIPIIILSAREASTERTKGLKLGADDYLVKPFDPDELVARIEAIKRRLEPNQNRKITNYVTLGNITIDQRRHLVLIGGSEIALTKIEWLLLSEMVRNAGKLLLYEDLLTRIWGPEYRDDVQILRTWISRLRNKIETASGNRKIIRTIPKTGYIIDRPVSEQE